MNYSLEITMNYIILAGGTSSVTRICNTDISNVKPSADNVGGGRKNDKLQGNLVINNKTGDYDAFGTYLNDSAYYVDEDNWSYKLWINGQGYTTNQIKLIDPNFEGKKLTFKLYGDIISEYTNLYANYDVEHNIIDGVSGVGNTTEYTDFRTLTDLGGTVQPNRSISSQTESEAIIDAFIDQYEDKIPYKIEFVNTGVAQFTPTVYYYQFEAIGYNSGTIADPVNQPPSGIDWIYDSVVSSQPKFVKKPRLISVGYSSWSSTSDYTANMAIEQEANITYSTRSRDLQDIITYLVGLADSTIGIDTDTYDGLLWVKGETIDSSFYFMQEVKLITASDFIPTLAGALKDNAASKGILTIGTIFSFLESYGFYWYLEDVSGTYTLRINHITLKSLGSANPDLTNYQGKNILAKTRNYIIAEDAFNKIINSSKSSGYNFRMPEYIYKTGTKTKSFSSFDLIADIDYIIDGRDTVFDLAEGKTWAFCLTTKPASTYIIRNGVSALNSIGCNNYELSFYWASLNLMEMPGKIGADGTVFDDSRLQKKKSVTLNLNVENPQEDFDFYSEIDYFGTEAEIVSLSKADIRRPQAQLKIKFI